MSSPPHPYEVLSPVHPSPFNVWHVCKDRFGLISTRPASTKGSVYMERYVTTHLLYHLAKLRGRPSHCPALCLYCYLVGSDACYPDIGSSRNRSKIPPDHLL